MPFLYLPALFFWLILTAVPSAAAERLTISLQALILVQEQETHYRYPAELLARTRSSLTAYPFGYLYPASVLFFWEREEQQGRFDPLFMNLWDIRRTLGFESLLIR